MSDDGEEPREGLAASTERGEEHGDELLALRSGLADAEDRHLRARAELENYRKRADRELERRVAETRASVLRSWLEVVDSVERALAHAPDPGLRAIADQMASVLARHGAERDGDVGEAFDPERHEAVGVVHSDEHPAGEIVDVARPGYAIDGQLLRPAQVVVARPPGERS